MVSLKLYLATIKKEEKATHFICLVLGSFLSVALAQLGGRSGRYFVL